MTSCREPILSHDTQPLRVRMRDGLALHLHRAGAGTNKCLMVHGFADGAYVWNSCMRAFSDAFDAIAVDLRGHGDSDWDGGRRYDIKTHTADISRVIDHLPGGRIVLMGHSLGAHIAVRIAAWQPKVLRALVLIDFGPTMGGEGARHGRENLKASLRLYRTIDEYAQWLMQSRPLLRQSMAEQLARGALQEVEGGFRLKIDPVLVDFDEESAHEEHALWQMLRAIRCPTLVVRGAGSAMLTRSVAESMVRTLPSGRLATIAGAGHAVMTDNSDEFNAALGEFFAVVAQDGSD